MKYMIYIYIYIYEIYRIKVTRSEFTDNSGVKVTAGATAGVCVVITLMRVSDVTPV